MIFENLLSNYWGGVGGSGRSFAIFRRIKGEVNVNLEVRKDKSMHWIPFKTETETHVTS